MQNNLWTQKLLFSGTLLVNNHASLRRARSIFPCGYTFLETAHFVNLGNYYKKQLVVFYYSKFLRPLPPNAVMELIRAVVPESVDDIVRGYSQFFIDVM